MIGRYALFPVAVVLGLAVVGDVARAQISAAAREGPAEALMILHISPPM